MKKIIMLFALYSLVSLHVCAQREQYEDGCLLLQDFLSRADTSFFQFDRCVKDRQITIIDVNKALSNCKINSVGTTRLTAITEGKEIDLVKQHGFLETLLPQPDLFIFQTKKSDKKFSVMLYYTRNNGIFVWTFQVEGKIVHFLDEDGGWY